MAEILRAERKQVAAPTPFFAGEVSVALAPPAERIALRARSSDLAALSSALGVALPTGPKGTSQNGSRHALWLGPDEWLLIDDLGQGLLSALNDVDVMHSSTDVSHRNNAFIVKGPYAANAINAGCPLNLSLKSFPVGACARTIFGKAEIVLYRVGDDEFRVECWRSFVDFVRGLLIEGAKDAAA